MLGFMGLPRKTAIILSNVYIQIIIYEPSMSLQTLKLMKMLDIRATCGH